MTDALESGGHDAAVAALAGELVGAAASLIVVIDHLARGRAQPPPAPVPAVDDPIDVLLRHLLAETLTPALRGTPPADLRATARVLARATSALGRSPLLQEPPR
jgi:hypothetical protein